MYVKSNNSDQNLVINSPPVTIVLSISANKSTITFFNYKFNIILIPWIFNSETQANTTKLQGFAVYDTLKFLVQRQTTI